MKTLNIVLPILILCLCYLGVTSVQDDQLLRKSDVFKWFGRTIAEVNEQCKQNSNSTLDRDTYRDYKTNLLDYLQPLHTETNPDTELSDHIFSQMYNSKMIEKLKDLLLHIQNCLDDEERLDPESLFEVLDGVIEIHTRRVSRFEPFSMEDMDKCEKKVGNKMGMCLNEFDDIFNDQLDDEKTTIYDLLTGNFVKKSSCKETLPLQQCVLKLFRPCSREIKNMFKIVFSPPEDIICDNSLEETDFNLMDDIPIEIDNKKGSFIRLFYK